MAWVGGGGLPLANSRGAGSLTVNCWGVFSHVHSVSTLAELEEHSKHSFELQVQTGESYQPQVVADNSYYLRSEID